MLRHYGPVLERMQGAPEAADKRLNMLEIRQKPGES
jgi:hypothetical protein